MAEDKSEVQISLNLNMNDFEGVTVHSFEVITQGEESRIDCIYVDLKPIIQGADAQGKIVARLNMSTSRLVELRDLLNNHLSKNGKGQE